MTEKKKTTKGKKAGEKTLVLLDVHAILHRAYHALPDFSSKSGEPTGALYGLSAFLIKIVREISPDYIVACYDLPEPTFRHEVYDDYKAGRAKTDEELVHQLNRSKDVFAAFGIPMYEHAGFEADDLLGTIALQTKKKKGIRTMIASGDMDTLQLVDGDAVVVYTLKKGINDTIIYNEKAVEERFGFSPTLLPDYKGLRGDPSDNIIGIKGVGEKTATTLIQEFGSLEDMYKALAKKGGEELFEKKGIKPRIINLLKEGEEEAFFSKTLGTIRVDAPITFSLPEKSWKDSVDVERVLALFSELDFNALRKRFTETVLGEAPEEEEVVEEKVQDIDTGELEKAAIALWVVNSDKTTPDLEDIQEFTGEDDFKKAVTVLHKGLKEGKLESVYRDIELPLIPILAKAQEKGIIVDVALLKNLSTDYHKKLSVLEKSIWKQAGEEFNIKSSKQLGEVLFDHMGISTKGLKKTAGGARSTKESELLKLKDENPIVADILSYRELQKLLSTYIDSIPELVAEDGRLHSTLNQTGTTTGRMSSVNPNMQNIPSREGAGEAIRSAFVAPKGYSLLAFDYSQIEMRLLAALSGDELMIEAFKSGQDIHEAVASHVFGVEGSEVTKDMRRKAKAINFGIMYGMGVNALKVGLGGTLAEAKEFYANYFNRFPTIEGYLESIKAGARKNGYTETVFGRRRYFEGMKSSLPFIRAQAERMALNAPLQGTAADIIKIAMKKADTALRDAGIIEDAELLLQIHDELIYEVKKSELEKAAKVVKEAMEDFPEISVPLTVCVSSGSNWGNLKDFS